MLFVAEFRLECDKPRALFLERLLSEAMRAHGYEPDLHIHETTETITWPHPSQDNAPSYKQTNYAKNLLGDLRRLLHNETEPTILEQGRLLLSAVNAAFVSPETDKRHMSHCINTLKEAIEDLTFKQRGLNTGEWS